MQRPPIAPSTTSYHPVSVAQLPGHRPTGSVDYSVPSSGVPPPPPRRASSAASSQDGSPTMATKSLLRPPPRRVGSQATLSPSGSVASLIGGIPGVASATPGTTPPRYASPPPGAALQGTAPRLGAPPPPPPPAAPIPASSNPTSLNPAPVPLGSRLSTFVRSKRLAPAASWLAAGASKIGSFVVGADGGPDDDQGPNESTSSAGDPPPDAAPHHERSNSSGGHPDSSSPPQAWSTVSEVPPLALVPPQSSHQRPPWPRPGPTQTWQGSSALNTPQPTQNVPEATSSVSLNSAAPRLSGVLNKSSSGAALAMLADSADQQPYGGPSDSSWTDSAPNQQANGAGLFELTTVMLFERIVFS
jgi:hypothetical protein